MWSPAPPDHAAEGPFHRQQKEPEERFNHLPKRLIVLDGTSIGQVYGKGNSAIGIEKTLKYFEAQGFKIKIFLPLSWKDGARAKTDQKRFNKMISSGQLVLTPTRTSDGALWRQFDCDVEDYIVRYAARHQAIIVSKRKFSELSEPALKEQVESRVLVFGFIDREFDPPNDPCGKGGPTLAEFLRFPSIESAEASTDSIQHKNQAHEDDLFKRHIIIDGSNVGFAFTNQTRFDVRGIEKSMDYFASRGHSVRAFIAESMLLKPQVSEHDKKVMRRMHIEGKLEVTPSRRTSTQSYDCHEDDYIIRNGIKKLGIILSNDNFRDFIARSPEYRDQIEKRVLPYNFIDGELWLPKDPLGRRGPCLDTFLQVPPELPREPLMGLLELDIQGLVPPTTSGPLCHSDIPAEIQEILNAPSDSCTQNSSPGEEDEESGDGWPFHLGPNVTVIDYDNLPQN